MNKEKLKKILESHKAWLAGGAREQADLSDADLRGADLSGANLKRASLGGANLKRASLGCANLTDASLVGANLTDAYLVGANLSGANLLGADLREADLSFTDLSGANLSYADLRSAYLSGADLREADLRSANLSGADLRHADLSDVKYSENTAFFALQCPEEGSFVGWKKCKNDVLVKLLIPEDAQRSSATSRKCRASKAIVLEIIGAEKAVSYYDGTFVYEVGEEVIPDAFDDNRWDECSNGISFFITRKEAENY